MEVLISWITYCEWFNFRGVLIFVVFVDSPNHEFQYQQNSNFWYKLWRKILWPQILNHKIGTQENKTIHSTCTSIQQVLKAQSQSSLYTHTGIHPYLQALFHSVPPSHLTMLMRSQLNIAFRPLPLLTHHSRPPSTPQGLRHGTMWIRSRLNIAIKPLPLLTHHSSPPSTLFLPRGYGITPCGFNLG